MTKPSAIANFYRGDTRKYKITVRDQDTSEPVNVNGGKLTITFKINKTDLDADAVLLIETIGVDSGPDYSGQILAVLTAAQTATLSPGLYYYDFQYVSVAGEVTTILPGETYYDKIKILEDITVAIA